MENSEFRPVTFQKEREKVLRDLASTSVLLTCLVGEDLHVEFRIVKMEGSRIEAEATAPLSRAIASAEQLQAIFGLDDGLYLVRSKVGKVFGAIVSFDVGGDIFRMQRRNNFRVAIPQGAPVSFELLSFNHSVKGKWTLAPIDLSAGGVRLNWLGPLAAKGLPPPKDDAHVSGILSLPDGKKMEVFGNIKTIVPKDGAHQVGVEFTNLAIRDEQTLLFICMQMLRARNSVYAKI